VQRDGRNRTAMNLFDDGGWVLHLGELSVASRQQSVFMKSRFPWQCSGSKFFNDR
jgi:hypothetical protein